MLQGILMFLMVAVAIFLILLILIQRGRGGGLAGVFGGMGGQSAFGTKAGDTFTRITIGVAAVWIILCVVTVKILGSHSSKFGDADLGAGAQPTKPPATAPFGEPAPETTVPSTGVPTDSSANDSAPAGSAPAGEGPAAPASSGEGAATDQKP